MSLSQSESTILHEGIILQYIYITSLIICCSFVIIICCACIVTRGAFNIMCDRLYIICGSFYIIHVCSRYHYIMYFLYYMRYVDHYTLYCHYVDGERSLCFVLRAFCSVYVALVTCDFVLTTLCLYDADTNQNEICTVYIVICAWYNKTSTAYNDMYRVIELILVNIGTSWL